jgi:hypothetical protein
VTEGSKKAIIAAFFANLGIAIATFVTEGSVDPADRADGDDGR